MSLGCINKAWDDPWPFRGAFEMQLTCETHISLPSHFCRKKYPLECSGFKLWPVFLFLNPVTPPRNAPTKNEGLVYYRGRNKSNHRWRNCPLRSKKQLLNKLSSKSVHTKPRGCRIPRRYCLLVFPLQYKRVKFGVDDDTLTTFE